MASGTWDQVDVTGDSGEVRRLTRKEFQALPLAERVKSILRKRLKFLARGVEVPVNDALKEM